MYIDADTIIKVGSLLTAFGILIGGIIAVYKQIETNRRQSEEIRAVQEEQTVLCYGMKGALQGLIEQGCDGPCKDALDRLDTHLNEKAHTTDL